MLFCDHHGVVHLNALASRPTWKRFALAMAWAGSLDGCVFIWAVLACFNHNLAYLSQFVRPEPMKLAKYPSPAKSIIRLPWMVSSNKWDIAGPCRQQHLPKLSGQSQYPVALAGLTALKRSYREMSLEPMGSDLHGSPIARYGMSGARGMSERDPAQRKAEATDERKETNPLSKSKENSKHVLLLIRRSLSPYVPNSSSFSSNTAGRSIPHQRTAFTEFSKYRKRGSFCLWKRLAFRGFMNNYFDSRRRGDT